VLYLNIIITLSFKLHGDVLSYICFKDTFILLRLVKTMCMIEL